MQHVYFPFTTALARALFTVWTILPSFLFASGQYAAIVIAFVSASAIDSAHVVAMNAGSLSYNTSGKLPNWAWMLFKKTFSSTTKVWFLPAQQPVKCSTVTNKIAVFKLSWVEVPQSQLKIYQTFRLTACLPRVALEMIHKLGTRDRTRHKREHISAL